MVRAVLKRDVLMVIPMGVDSIRLHFTRSLEAVPDGDKPSCARAYSYCPICYDRDGYDWWIYVDPCSDLLLICELLAHEASHILDFVDLAWGAQSPTEKACLGEARAYMAQAIVRYAPFFMEPVEG